MLTMFLCPGFLSDDIAKNELGSEANLAILKAVKPTYYFAAHLHVRFAAVFPHRDSQQPNEPHVRNLFLSFFCLIIMHNLDE